jgi:hypothetical protein
MLEDVTMKKVAWMLGGALALAAVGGCAESPESGVESQKLGKVSLAVTAQGADGFLYRLPPGTQLELRTTDGSVVERTHLDYYADRTSIEYSAGDYLATLDGITDGSGQVRLYRERPDGNSTSDVSARLVGPAAQAVSILPGQTTALTFRFAVAELGDVVFSVGSVDVGIALEDETDPSQGVGFDIASTTTVVSMSTQSEGAHPGLHQLSSVTYGDTVSPTLGFTRTSEWRISAEDVCADVAVDYAYTVDDPAVSELLYQATDGVGSLCFSRPSSGGNVYFYVHREGTSHPSSQVDLQLPDPMSVRISGFGQPSRPLLEGGTLRLSELDEPFMLHDAQIGVETGTSEFSTMAWVTVAGTFTIVARL